MDDKMIERCADSAFEAIYGPVPVELDDCTPETKLWYKRGVVVTLAGATPAEYHDAWRYFMVQRGWQHADEFVPTQRKNPSLVPYEQLAVAVQDDIKKFIDAVLTEAKASGWEPPKTKGKK